MQLGQHLILLLAGHQKPHERMMDHLEPSVRDVSNPRDSPAWRHLLASNAPVLKRPAGRLQGQAALVTATESARGSRAKLPWLIADEALQESTSRTTRRQAAEFALFYL